MLDADRDVEEEMTGAADEPDQGIVLTVAERTQQSTVLVHVTGELDMASAPRLWATLSEVLRCPEVRLAIVDLGAVSFLAVAGMRILAQALALAEHHRTAFRVVVDRSHPVVRRMAECGQIRGLVLLDDLDEALRTDAVTVEGLAPHRPRRPGTRLRDRPDG